MASLRQTNEKKNSFNKVLVMADKNMKKYLALLNQRNDKNHISFIVFLNEISDSG